MSKYRCRMPCASRINGLLAFGRSVILFSDHWPATAGAQSTPNCPRGEQMQSVNGAAVSVQRMVAIGLGNALEFYDFMISSFFAVQIGHAFFPPELGGQGLLYTLA